MDLLKFTQILLVGVAVSACNKSTSPDTQTDLSSPLVLSSTPSGILAAGNQNMYIELLTDEIAQCQYDTQANKSYESMTLAFDNTNSTLHSFVMESLIPGEQYSYFVRCKDDAGNINTSDYVIKFSIEDMTKPVRSNGSPNNTLSSDTTSTNLTLVTSKEATCKYDVIADTGYDQLSNTFSLTGKKLHGTTLSGLIEGSSQTYYVRCQDADGNTNESDYAIRFSIADTNAPILSQSTPTVNQPSGTQSLTLQLNTNETATCRYSSTADTAFAAMTNTFAADGNTHRADITDLEDGGAYQYYVRCEDIAGNATGSDYLFSFSIANLLDLTPPVISNGLPTQPLATGTDTSEISVVTDENAVCKYDIYSGRDFDAMGYNFDNTGLTSHSTSITALSNGVSYNYYIRCKDSNDNINASEYQIGFSVLGEIATGTPWSYPAIPYTDWAYNPFTIQLTKPGSWPTAPAQDYYYVEPDHPMATDTQDGDELRGDFGRFGYPDKPRKNIPSRSWITDVFTAGTVIWMKGGIHTRDSFRGLWSPQFHGTAEQPIWFYGDPLDKPTFEGPIIRIYNSAHVIFDNLQWIGSNRENTVLSLTRDRAGPTHHVTLRNLHFENLNWINAGGAIIALTAGTDNGNELHDVVAYKNTFKNNGGGFDWNLEDGDHHAYKVNGIPGENAVYRIWIIDNQALRGDEPDPIDGLYKSISGNLVQVGDMTIDNSGDNHHVYVAGNYQEFARQALGWTKRSSDVIFSSNTCTDTYALAGANGQCYGHQYALGSYNWWINNIGRNSASGWMHTSNDNMTGPLFIVGNLFYNNKKNESDDNWRVCSGVTLFNQRGEHYITNNVFDDSCYGIWAQNNRHTSNDKLHIYNNIFSNISGTIDTNSKALALENTGGISIFVENNLFDNFSNSSVIGQTHVTIADLNAENWAANNIEAAPGYLDQANRNYNTNANSSTTDKGTQSYNSGAPDVYQQFIDRYTNDPYYPGDPRDYWPKDFLNKPRVGNGAIDIGPYEN